MNRNFVQHIEVAKQLHPEAPSRIETDTSEMVSLGLDIAARAAVRPPETKQEPAKPVLQIYNFS